MVSPITTDTTFLNYNTTLNDRTSRNSFNSTFINTQETFNKTRNLTQQDIQAASHFLNEEIIEKLPTATQRTFSPIHPIFTTPHNHITKLILLSLK